MVDVSFPVANVAATSIKVRISVTGCAQVASVTLTDRDQPITIPAFVSNPLEFELNKDQISFREGVRAKLLLKAKATCGDGTSGESIPVGGTFFPVAQVISPPSTGSAAAAVADVFYVDEGVFYGCLRLTNGTRAIARTDASGALIATVANPYFQCRAGGAGVQYTGRTGTSWAWVFDPEQGAFAYDTQLNRGDVHLTRFSSSGYPGFAPGLTNRALTLREDGYYIQLWRPEKETADGFNGVWDHEATGFFEGYLASFQSWLGAPRAIDGATPTYFFSSFFSVRGADENVTAVWALADVGSGVPGFAEYVHFKATPPARTSAFNEAATKIYYAQAVDAGTTRIVSCTARAANCTPATSVTLPAVIGSLAVHANDTRLIAVSSRQLWILDAATLQVLNPSGQPLLTTGALEWKYLDFGPGEQLVLMSGPTASTLPTEVAVYESATAGELYRFESPADSLYLAFDAGGQPWMRHGSQLLKLLTTAEYKALKAR